MRWVALLCEKQYLGYTTTKTRTKYVYQSSSGGLGSNEVYSESSLSPSSVFDKSVRVSR